MIRQEFDDGTTESRIDLTYTDNNLVETRVRYSDLAGTSEAARTTYSYNAEQAVASIGHSGDGGTIVSFELEGGKARAFRFLNALKLIDISNNLGDSKSLITHPTTTTHQRLSPAERAELDITDGLLRLSIGLEDVEDLKDDLAQALTA